MVDTLIHLLKNVGSSIYVYCTDFTINLANLTGTSYYEINFFFFCVLFPILVLVLPVTAIVLKFRLKHLKSRIQHTNPT